MSKNIKTIFFDFDGTLSNDRFYKPVVSEDLLEDISKVLFDEKLKELVFPWMRGEIDYKEVHRRIATDIDTDPKHLDKYLIKSLRDWKINEDLLNFVDNIRSNEIQTAIFSDNMDVFTEYLIPFNDLDQYFDYIFSSYDFGGMKLDENGKMIDHALEEVYTPPEQALFIDDFKDLSQEVKKRGAEFYYYENYGEEFKKFKQWFNKKT